MPLSRSVARFNRRATNRVTRLFAGHVPSFSMLTHTGRRSGQTYSTPINVLRDGDDYLIMLTYGPQTDWVRNVMASGSADLLVRGRHVTLTNPRIVTDPSMRVAPWPARLILKLAGVTQYIRLTPVAISGATPSAGSSVATG